MRSSAAASSLVVACLALSLVDCGGGGGGGTGGNNFFQDDFNRADSNTIGNGWGDLVGNIDGNLKIRDNRAAATVTGSGGGIYRTLAASRSTTISATVTQASGFLGTERVYDASIRTHNDGIRGNGYGVRITRSGRNFTDSRVRLVDDATELARVDVPFQFGPSIRVEVTIQDDGTVVGTVSQTGESFNFSFDRRSFRSDGDSVALDTIFPDEHSNSFIYPTLDDVVLSD